MGRTASGALALGLALLGTTPILLEDSPRSCPPGCRRSGRFRIGVDAVRIDAVVTDREAARSRTSPPRIRSPPGRQAADGQLCAVHAG